MNRWTTGVYAVNGINIHCLRTGDDKPPVILLHGLMTSGACWAPVARMLEADYDVIMPDARGHGNSSVPTQGYSYDRLASDVLGLIESLGLVKPVLIGHSMGGMTAAVVGSKNSEKLGGIVLADPTFLTPEVQRQVYQSDVVVQHRLVLNRSRKDFLAEKISRSKRSRELIELLVEARFQTSIHAFEILKPPNLDYQHLIRSLAVSSLLVIGDSGSVVTQKVAAELADLNESLNIVQIRDAGHGIPFDQPKRFGEVAKKFLNSLATSI